MNKYQEALRDIEKINSTFKVEVGYFIGKDIINTIRELVDKAIPKATEGPWSKCPNCGVHIEGGHDLPMDCIDYCFACGQALKHKWQQKEKINE